MGGGVAGDECWDILKINPTLEPSFESFFPLSLLERGKLPRGEICEDSPKNSPSPSVNPANQWGSGIPNELMAGRATGIVLGKAAFNFTDKPQFIDTRMATILRKPSVVRCSPRFIISIASPSLFERWDASPPPPPHCPPGGGWVGWGGGGGRGR